MLFVSTDKPRTQSADQIKTCIDKGEIKQIAHHGRLFTLGNWTNGWAKQKYEGRRFQCILHILFKEKNLIFSISASVRKCISDTHFTGIESFGTESGHFEQMSGIICEWFGKINTGCCNIKNIEIRSTECDCRHELCWYFNFQFDFTGSAIETEELKNDWMARYCQS